MLRCILKNIQKYFKIFPNYAFIIKTTLSYFYATFKQWKQEVESPYMYFSLIRLIPKNFMTCT